MLGNHQQALGLMDHLHFSQEQIHLLYSLLLHQIFLYHKMEGNYAKTIQICNHFLMMVSKLYFKTNPNILFF